MSSFAVKVERVTISAHENADALEIASIGDYQAVVRKGQFKSGDLVAYVPEQALIPPELLAELGLEGKLAGKDKNRLKAVKLRGVLSQGLVYPARSHWNEGDDVTEELGIEKWEPPVPAHLAGEVYAAGQDRTLKYDLENYKRFPHILQEGEEVVFTEKLHGTWTLIGVMPESMAHPEHGRLIVSSKGLSARGLAMKPNTEANKSNLYVRVARHLNLENRLQTVFRETLSASGELSNGAEPAPVFVLGETFGRGVQDLSYGAKVDQDFDIGFRVFDIFVGNPKTTRNGSVGRYLNDAELEKACQNLELERVPVLYRGPFSKEAMKQYTDGFETVSGKKLHIREGIVIRPTVERYSEEIGRVQLKNVSEKYLLRKNGTEFN